MTWLSTLRPVTLIVIRAMILANAVLLGIIGGLYLVFAARPGGAIVAGILWAGALALLALLPATRPRRGNSRW